jgi:hypothetical protein
MERHKGINLDNIYPYSPSHFSIKRRDPFECAWIAVVAHANRQANGSSHFEPEVCGKVAGANEAALHVE